MELIKNELKMIDCEANEILCACKNGKMKRAKYFMKKFHRNRLKWVREFYSSIYDMCDILNGVFAWSNVFAILISFQLILTDFNWFYWKMFNNFRVDIFGNDLPQNNDFWIIILNAPIPIHCRVRSMLSTFNSDHIFISNYC